MRQNENFCLETTLKSLVVRGGGSEEYTIYYRLGKEVDKDCVSDKQ